MMPTAVTDLLQRVVLTEYADRRTAAAVFIHCPEGCRKVCDPTLHQKAILFQIIREKRGGLNLISPALRVVINKICHGDELLSLFLQRCKDLFFHNSPLKYITAPVRSASSVR